MKTSLFSFLPFAIRAVPVESVSTVRLATVQMYQVLTFLKKKSHLEFQVYPSEDLG